MFDDVLSLQTFRHPKIAILFDERLEKKTTLIIDNYTTWLDQCLGCKPFHQKYPNIVIFFTFFNRLLLVMGHTLQRHDLSGTGILTEFWPGLVPGGESVG